MTIRCSSGFRTALMGSDSFLTIFANCVLEIRSGPQPASADNAATGVLLGVVTLNGDAFSAGTATNGLNFEMAPPPDAGLARKPATDVWRMTGLADGTAGHYRLKANAADAGAASTTHARIDGSIGSSGADLLFSNLGIVTGAPVSIDQFTFQLPAG